jgi:hypothetical protein
LSSLIIYAAPGETDLPDLNHDQQMIREAVSTLGLTHKGAAAVFGVSYAALHAWVNGLRSPTSHSLHLVAQGLEAYAKRVERMGRQVAQHSH